MYIRERTWIEYGPRRARGTMTSGRHLPARGVGAAPCPSLEQLAGVVDLADPCQAALAGGQIPTESPYPVVFSPAPGPAVPGPSGGFCFSGSFPWFGQKQPDGSCQPALAVPSPWGMVLTVGLGGLLIYQVLGGGGRRR